MAFSCRPNNINFRSPVGKGHVVLLDSWVARGFLWAGMAYVGTTPDELASLKPEVIFIGHTHFDHNADLPDIIRANPDALIVGTAEHCGESTQTNKITVATWSR